MKPPIHIRPFAAGDAPAFHEAARESSPEVFPWLPWCRPDYSGIEAQQWVDSRQKLFEEGREFCFVIADAEDRFLGCIDISQVHATHRMANVGYWVRSSEAGQGIIPQAIRMVADFAFRRTILVRLEILCDVENVRSQRAAEKAGAVREGVLRHRLFVHDQPHDAVMYSVLRSDWNGV